LRPLFKSSHLFIVATSISCTNPVQYDLYKRQKAPPEWQQQQQQQQQTPKNTGLIGTHYKQILLYCTTQSINCVESIAAVMHKDHINLAQSSAPPLYVAHLFAQRLLASFQSSWERG